MKKIEKKDLARIYDGDVKIRNVKEWEAFAKKKDKEVTGSIDMQGCTGLTSVTFPKEVTGSIDMQGCTGLTSVTFPDKVSSIYMQGCTGLTSVTFPKEVTGYIYMDDKSSELLLSMQHKKIRLLINGVQFDRPLFDKVRKGELPAAEVFAITHTEQRRVAYEKMDKIKIKDLAGFTVLDEASDDGHGYPMRIINFTMDSFDDPFYYLNCFCPSTGREYYLETRQATCNAAKMASFGLKETEKFDAEY